MLLLIWSVLWVLIPLSGLEGVFPIQVSASSMSGTSNVGPVPLVSGNSKQWAWMLAAWRNPSSPEAHRTHKHIKTSNYKGLTWSGCSDGKESAWNVGDLGLIHRVGTIPCRRKWLPTPVFLPGESPWTEETRRLQSMGLQSQTRLSD